MSALPRRYEREGSNNAQSDDNDECVFWFSSGLALTT